MPPGEDEEGGLFLHICPDGSERSFEHWGSVAGNQQHLSGSDLFRVHSMFMMKLYIWVSTTKWTGRQERRSWVAGSHVSQERALYCSKTNLWWRQSSVGTCKHAQINVHSFRSSDPSSLPEHIRSVIRIQWVGVLAVEELVWLDRRDVQVQRSLGGKKLKWDLNLAVPL